MMNYIDKVALLIEESKKYSFNNNCYTAAHGTYSRASPQLQAWIAECEDFIIINYGLESAPYRVYARFGIRNMHGNYQDKFDHHKDIIVSALEACLRIEPKGLKLAVQENKAVNTSQVFIVHGHDEEVKTKVARFVERLGFEAIILHEQASSGNTIIEKIEAYSDVGFGIVLYTACDLGGKSAVTPELKARARQNVVFEHGYLIGKIGRGKVCALVKGDIETPTDISGVVYVTMDNANAWHIEIAKELRRAGYNIDMNKVF